ncbi:MAG: sigma-70 family RNA polymerase sigma factor [Planctomycetes bacterium]|nr:sigma-70 family RNA polymerase sigma factor [Planctomycetota bacterium]
MSDSMSSPDLEALVAQHHQVLFRYAYRLSGSVADAEDLTQQTFAALLAKNPDRVEHLGYARQTMVRLWLDRQRSVRRRALHLARLAFSARRWHADADRLSAGEQKARMRRAIESLPPKQRAVLVLRLVEEVGYDQIASALNCSVQTVRAHLHLGRRRLREMLGEQP